MFELAWPTVLLNLLQVINNLLDRFFLGKLPQSHSTALGGGISWIFMIFVAAMSVAIGVGAIIARSYGAQEKHEYQTAARQGLAVAFLTGLATAVIGWASAGPFARLALPAEDADSQRLLVQFLGISCLGIPAMFIVTTLSSAMRSIGDSMSPMVISGLQILLHIAGNLALVPPRGGPVPSLGLGLYGAAIAMAGSAWISALLYIGHVSRTPLALRVGIHLPSADWWRRILRIAIPSFLQGSLRTLSLLAFTATLGILPTSEIAIGVIPAGFAIESLMFAQAFGISSAAGALVGQNLGAKAPDRAEKVGWLAGGAAFGIALITSVVVYGIAPVIAGLFFPNSADSRAELIRMVQWLCYTEPLFCLSMALIGAMQGAGDTKRPFWIGVIALWMLRLPAAIILCLPAGSVILSAGKIKLPFGLAMGAVGAWIAMSVTQGIQGLMSMWAWKQGAWKTVKV